MNAKPTFAEHLMSMPNVGDDADFERVQESEILEGMIDQMNKTTLRAESAVDKTLAQVDASNLRLEILETQAALDVEVTSDGTTLEKALAALKAALALPCEDPAATITLTRMDSLILLEALENPLPRSEKQIEAQAKARLDLRGSVLRFDDPTAPVSEDDWRTNVETRAAMADADAIAPRPRKKYKLGELLAECDPNAPMPQVPGWEEIVPVGKEILDDQAHKT